MFTPHFGTMYHDKRGNRPYRLRSVPATSSLLAVVTRTSSAGSRSHVGPARHHGSPPGRMRSSMLLVQSGYHRRTYLSLLAQALQRLDHCIYVFVQRQRRSLVPIVVLDTANLAWCRRLYPSYPSIKPSPSRAGPNYTTDFHTLAVPETSRLPLVRGLHLHCCHLTYFGQT